MILLRKIEKDMGYPMIATLIIPYHATHYVSRLT